jgi:hypothetical protein
MGGHAGTPSPATIPEIPSAHVKFDAGPERNGNLGIYELSGDIGKSVSPRAEKFGRWSFQPAGSVRL